MSVLGRLTLGGDVLALGQPVLHDVLGHYLLGGGDDDITFSLAPPLPIFVITETWAFSDYCQFDPIFDTFAFGDTIVRSITTRRSVTESLSLSDSRVASLIRPIRLTDFFSMHMTVYSVKVSSFTITESFTLTDKVIGRLIIAEVVETLDLTDDIDSLHILKPVLTESWTITDAVACNITKNLAIVETLVLTDFSPDDYSSPSGDIPGLIRSAIVLVRRNLVLQGLRQSIALPRPNFNDYERDNNQILVKRYMDANHRTYTKTNYQTQLKFDFTLTRAQAMALRDFLIVDGNDVIYISYNGLNWTTTLSSSSIDFTEDARWEPCGNRNQVSVEFVGTRR